MKNYAESMKIRDLAIITKSQYTSCSKNVSKQKLDDSEVVSNGGDQTSWLDYPDSSWGPVALLSLL